MMGKEKQKEIVQKLKLIGSWLEEKKGEDLLLLDVSKLSNVFEGVILATASNARHAKGLADYILEKVKEENWELLGLEGYQGGEWILLDLNDVIVHIFLEDIREFYNLEGFWFKAEKVEL
ncbi:MAG: ribosome-associated protein [Desulfonauticus sp.]|nr:MAG: Ribosomal silencing factor RsfS [Desulfonauticus sp. 38_4375]MDK2921507.1 ribosome-associated protein [Desulfonauticus sp.]